MTKNVFVVGLNAMNAERLTRLRGVEDVVFHPLLTSEAVSDTQEFDIPAMLREAEATLDAFDGSIDAIVGYIDFPVSTMLPLLCAKYGTRNASLESLLKCEHKYWSRKVMAEVDPRSHSRSSPHSIRSTTTRSRRSARLTCAFPFSSSRSNPRARVLAFASTARRISTTRSPPSAPRSARFQSRSIMFWIRPSCRMRYGRSKGITAWRNR